METLPDEDTAYDQKQDELGDAIESDGLALSNDNDATLTANEGDINQEEHLMDIDFDFYDTQSDKEHLEESVEHDGNIEQEDSLSTLNSQITNIAVTQEAITSAIMTLPQTIFEKFEQAMLSDRQTGIRYWIGKWLGIVGSRKTDREIKKLQTRVKTLHLRREQMKLQHQASAESQQHEIEQMRAEGWRLTSQNEVLANEVNRLKTIITSSIDEDELLDQTIVRDFAAIRSDIQRLAHTFLATLETSPVHAAYNETAYFYQKVWIHCEDDISRRRRLRAEIWQCLFQRIFRARCFDVEDQMEEALAKAEEALVKASGMKVQESELAEWRKLTLSCVNKLPSRSPVPREVSLRIHDLIKPVIQKRSESNSKLATKQVRNLCEAAYSLTMKLRRSKASFQFKEPHANEVLQNEYENLISVEEVEGELPDNDNLAGLRVKYTLFGSLTKIDHTYGNTIVLEPALVVCRK